jgi:peptidoglycan/LPS O-acetylase OafA/YrhL
MPYEPYGISYVRGVFDTSTLRRELGAAVWPGLTVRTSDGYPYISLDVPGSLVPQAWSIGIEMLFYLVAPLLVIVARWHRWAFGALLILSAMAFLWGVTGRDFRFVDNYVYKNAFSSLIFFASGAALWFCERHIAGRVPYAVTAGALGAWLLYLPLLSPRVAWGGPEPTPSAFIVHVLLMIPLSVLACRTAVPERLRTLDGFIGNLSYGMYLNHLVVASALLAAGELAYERSGAVLLSRGNSLRFGLLALLGSAFCAALGYWAIERPFERWRGRVRPRVPAPAVHAILEHGRGDLEPGGEPARGGGSPGGEDRRAGAGSPGQAHARGW